MSNPFKMKGWSGYQKPSPARKDWKDVVQDFKAVKEDLESKMKDIGSGKMGKKIKSDLQGLQKEISKKLGKKEEVMSEDIVSNENIASEKSSSVVDPGDLVETNPWTSGKGNDPWEYRKTDKGYQTRKGKQGRIIDVTDPTTDAYQKIGEKIFDVEPVNIESPGVVPANVKAIHKNLTYEAYLNYKDYYDAKASGQPYTGMSEATKNR